MKHESTRLTKDERKIQGELRGELYQSIGAEEQDQFIQLAKNHSRLAGPGVKSQRINMRLRRDDLTLLKERAEQKGLPYQSLLASIIHRYLNGTLVEIDQLKAIVKALKEPAKKGKSA